MRQFFEEQDGKLSMTRLTIFMLVVAYILQAAYIVITTKAIPDISYGVAGLIAMLYGLNTDFLKVHVGGVKNEGRDEG